MSVAMWYTAAEEGFNQLNIGFIWLLISDVYASFLCYREEVLINIEDRQSKSHYLGLSRECKQ